MVRQGMKKIIEESRGMEVFGEASDGLELLNVLKNITADMVVLDITMPNLRGIEATREIKMTYPETKILILTMHKKKEFLYHGLSAGGLKATYLKKTQTPNSCLP
jgi:DNA-binding NarL/FixJ family response regulator